MARGVSDRSVNFEKICAVNNMSRSFVAGKITLEEATQKVLEIHYAPSFAPWQRILGYALTSGGLTMVYNGTFWDGVAAFFIGTLLGIMTYIMSKRKTSYFFSSFTGGLLTGLLACLFHLILPFTQIDMMIVGSIMPILPGITLTKGIRDLLEGNFISGNAKLMEAFLIACAIAAGVAMALSIFPNF